MPDGNYADNAACSWLIDCATGQANPRPPVVRITQMDVESDYEYARPLPSAAPLQSDQLARTCAAS